MSGRTRFLCYVAKGCGVGGVAIVAAVMSVTSFWYGGNAFMAALQWARFGVLNVPALVVGAIELWAGGLLGLAAGTLVREPPAMPDRTLIVGWTVVIFAGVIAVMVMRRPEIEEALPERTRRMMVGVTSHWVRWSRLPFSSVLATCEVLVIGGAGGLPMG